MVVLAVALAVDASVPVLIIQLLKFRATGSAGDEAGNAFTQWLAGVRTLGRHRTALVLVLFAALDSAVYGASTRRDPAEPECCGWTLAAQADERMGDSLCG